MSEDERKSIEDIKLELAEAQKDDTKSPEEIKELTLRLRAAYQDEEEYWHQKSRSLWMRVGDQNTKFFHAQTKQRQARNRIVGLFNEAGMWITEDTGIQEVAVLYFTDLFTSTNPMDFEEALQDIRLSITEDINVRLTREATEQEIRTALFLMHPEKAPGPDGMTALFYQKSWEIIKDDLVLLVNSFFQNDSFDNRLNTTNICLIPKTERPTKMSDLRPISLCNVGYKIISKVLCQRLKRVLPVLISETQSAFVEGRLISDNILIAQEMFHGLQTNPSCKGKYMAIKTDMSKAYDRLEWPFIAKVMEKMGFCEKWIAWMMCCITSVQYRVLLNGQPRGLIIPDRGLRQGDPLSPYLFILCTEVLIANIRRAEAAKLITGIKVARASPAISHLLFADDSLFFCQAKKEQCEVILGILKQYEKVSGQQINFTKSSIQFGHLVENNVRTELMAVLGITTLGGMGSYLGLPESLGGAKTRVFSFVQDRLQSRINGWSAKFLSKGGGLGFRHVEDFNSALLAKQLWRLINVPDCLFAQVFKGRYYRKSDPLGLIKSYSPSYGWRSIISARPLVSKGLIKGVGTGESISVWNDPWLPAQYPRPATRNSSLAEPLTNLSVNQLIDTQTGSWKVQLLQALFDPEDVPIISAIPIRFPQGKDYRFWHFTKSGKYSVKSGYMVSRDTRRTCNVYGPDTNQLQAHVWKVKCPPKLRHFLWQVLRGCISVNNNLARRGLNCDPLCSRCGEVESTLHAVFQCPPTLQTWALSQVPTAPGVFPTESLFANMDHLFWRTPKDLDVSMYPWIMWYIWKARNEKVFDNIDRDPREVLRLAECEAQSWFDAQMEGAVDTGSGVPRGLYQINDPSSIRYPGFTCFVDGSWKEGDIFAGLGWYCTATNGEPTMGASNFRRSLSPLHTEVEALVWAMKCMIEAGRREVTFITDCSDLVEMVSSPTEWPAFVTYLEEIIADREVFSSFGLVKVSRRSNLKADALARRIRVEPLSCLYVNNVPSAWLF
ncbi:uncharacterized protein LOC111829476 [Capsella rubella]|uniref:uncharacterized protein LOC111829476 n=1 Tax=Capsella rubella TaxID=81985 RepID=UPI000CD51586|nr:uncharacterized protein LOC111829476 [Capsella rubella]